MKEALSHGKAAELVVRNMARTAAMPLIVEAQRLGIDFTIVGNPEFIGDVAVALVAREAVDVPASCQRKSRNKTAGPLDLLPLLLPQLWAQSLVEPLFLLRAELLVQVPLLAGLAQVSLVG